MDATAILAPETHAEFADLLQRHRGIVFKVAGTYARGAEDRADLAQEIAGQLWRAWPRYDRARPFATWMYRVALNVGISWLRDASRERAHAVPLDEALHDLAHDDRDEREREDGLRVLRAFIATLPALDRALLLLHLEARSTREMADVLGISESNTTTRLSRLRQRLRDHAARCGLD